MYNEINHQMEEAQQGIFRLRKIDSMLNTLYKNEKELKSKVSDLKDTLEKEDQDVDKLEQKSLTHLFYRILGNIEEKKDKERQEALAAKLKYEQALNELTYVQDEITKLKQERENYKSSDRTYQTLLARKKELLMQTNAATSEKILHLTEKIQRSKNNVKEIQEAISVGRQVLQRLKDTLDSLNSAQGWGRWDLLGGGLITDMIKHSHIDDAKSMAEKTQMALLRFRTELADVKIEDGIQFEMNGFAKFADFFFDGLIADWVMQSRIHDSQDSVIRVQNQVENVMAKLKSLEYKENEYREQLEMEINELVVKA
jgi:myosin heavy subunit